MGTDLASNDDQERHRDGAKPPHQGIPSPRPPLDDDIENLPDIGIKHPPHDPTCDPVWRYDQPRRRGEDRRYWGQVERIGGPEGDRLRENLAATIRDLLDWVAQHTENSEKDSRDDGGADDTTT